MREIKLFRQALCYSQLLPLLLSPTGHTPRDCRICSYVTIAGVCLHVRVTES